jgi:hypothetical protein
MVRASPEARLRRVQSSLQARARTQLLTLPSSAPLLEQRAQRPARHA